MKYDSNPQTISWFKDRFNEGTLSIKPPYQRRPVWTIRQKSHLIETVLLGLPIPEIYIHVTIDDEGKSNYAVVDGQQRIRTILQFFGADLDASEQEYNNFSLEKISRESEYYDLRFGDLSAGQRQHFFGYRLAVREITQASDDDVRDVFVRLNKFLTKLNDQELRNAIYSGPFLQLADALAQDEYWAENGIVSPAIIRRMGDIEFVSELLIGTIDGPQSGKAQVIDEYYQRFEDCDDEFPGQREIRRRFLGALRVIELVLPDIKETRWRNRTDFYSLFVAMTHLLRTSTVSEADESISAFRRKLDHFESQVQRAIESPQAATPGYVAEYSQAHVKGSSEKSRRASRHEALLHVIEPCFVMRKTDRGPKRSVVH
ncbi:MAG: DUF262 domain-containing protein [Planctomycetales bacterium]